jgi:hypothetical protein
VAIACASCQSGGCSVRNAIPLCPLRRTSSRRQLFLRPNGLFNRRLGNYRRRRYWLDGPEPKKIKAL